MANDVVELTYLKRRDDRHQAAVISPTTPPEHRRNRDVQSFHAERSRPRPLACVPRSVFDERHSMSRTGITDRGRLWSYQDPLSSASTEILKDKESKSEEGRIQVTSGITHLMTRVLSTLARGTMMTETSHNGLRSGELLHRLQMRNKYVVIHMSSNGPSRPTINE